MKANVTERPPFDCDPATMLAWLRHMLVSADNVALRLGATHYARVRNEESDLEIAKRQWRGGDPVPLRELYPEIAECILQYRCRAKPKLSRIQFAYDTKKVILAIWREHYPGRVRHKPHDAAWFAAQLWEWSVDNVRKHEPPGNKHRQK